MCFGFTLSTAFDLSTCDDGGAVASSTRCLFRPVRVSSARRRGSDDPRGVAHVRAVVAGATVSPRVAGAYVFR